MVLRRAVELLESVGLDRALATRYPGELSGGQRQRVVIARALGLEPEMILLDEPVSALDASARAQILNLLSDLKARSGVTMVYITHDLATVGYLCERIVVLFAGLIMEDLPFERLRDAPDNPYTQALTAASQLPTKAQVDGSDEMPGRQAGCPFAPQCPSAQDICRNSVPDLVELQPGWRSRCHFAGKRKPNSSTIRTTVPAHA
jgi:oligopeptide/dipeptide ABC transporter ATP-binding protein